MINDKKVPLSNVLNYVTKAVIDVQKDNNELLKWALNGFRKLNHNNLQYVDSYDFFDVTNHQTQALPSNIQEIKEVKILVENSDLFDLTAEDYTGTTYFSSFINNSQFWTRMSEIDPQRIGYYCNISNRQFVYALLHTTAEHRYIQVPFPTACILVKYKELLLDQDTEEFLLPEKPQVLWEYLGSYVAMQHWKERKDRGEQSAFQLYKDYQQETAAYFQATKNQINHANLSIDYMKKVLYSESDFTRYYSFRLRQYHTNQQ